MASRCAGKRLYPALLSMPERTHNATLKSLGAPQRTTTAGLFTDVLQPVGKLAVAVPFFWGTLATLGTSFACPR